MTKTIIDTKDTPYWSIECSLKCFSMVFRWSNSLPRPSLFVFPLLLRQMFALCNNLDFSILAVFVFFLCFSTFLKQEKTVLLWWSIFRTTGSLFSLSLYIYLWWKKNRATIIIMMGFFLHNNLFLVHNTTYH